ncbi:hypothetical protein E5676_scaffold313G00970 [Cucumis melo var. makuwa]|uniref:Uncharacterized protein n=1 Tax=Cucumis melo var. makuwa TaxID=1194695 RepID=A0A5A7VLL9_CUCMM|nr:hypothetical protein E6C27_scaffold40G00200 [Cucumis melo var. makuwa]TYK26517.1 hypothetical protein E5676_scaffold313G00970 [Cucumis melo var. makuwa]
MVRRGATKCTGQRPTKGKQRWASDEGQATMGGVGSGVLCERKEKGKRAIREREGIDRGEKGKQTWKRERKRRAFLSIHTQIVLKILIISKATHPKDFYWFVILSNL